MRWRASSRGEQALGKELLRDYINATVGLPKLGQGYPVAREEPAPDVWDRREILPPATYFEIVAYLQRCEGVRLHAAPQPGCSVRVVFSHPVASRQGGALGRRQIARALSEPSVHLFSFSLSSEGEFVSRTAATTRAFRSTRAHGVLMMAASLYWQIE